MLLLFLACTAEITDSSSPDEDGDGFIEDDCFEGRADIHPDADELCDGWDNDCDGDVDEDPVNGTGFYVDADGDGFGGGEATWSCEPVADRVSNGGDCDDGDALAWTGAAEDCFDGVDNDCNGDADCDDVACEDELACQDDTGFDGATQLDLVLVDYLGQTPIVGAEADGGDDSDTSNDSGQVRLTLGYDAPLWVEITADGYPLHTLAGHGGPEGELTQVSAVYPMISTNTLSFLAQALGVAIDPSDGLVNVSVVNDDGSPLAGVTVAPSSSFDVALVPDSASSSGLSPGNTTLDGSASSVFFVNAAAGATTYTVTPPNGMACLEAPGGSLPIGAETVAGAVNAVMVVCVPSG